MYMLVLAQACFNQPMTLSVDLSESLYDIQWKSDPANAFDGVPGADLKKSSVTFNPQIAAKYFVTYKMKAGRWLSCSREDYCTEGNSTLRVTKFHRRSDRHDAGCIGDDANESVCGHGYMDSSDDHGC